MPNTLLQDLQEINAAFRCGTCPGGPEESCDDDCDKHRLEYMAEGLNKKGYRKVTECKDCRYNDRCIILAGMCDQIQFCSLGESKEGE